MKRLARVVLFLLILYAAPAAVTARAALPVGVQRIATLKIGRAEPVIVDAVRHHVFVGNESQGSLSVVDDRTQHIVKTIRVGREVEDLALDSAAGRLYTANSRAQTVSVVSTTQLRVVATISVPKNPAGVAVDSSRHRLYVVSSGADSVSAIDTQKRRVTRTVSVPGGPQGIAVCPGCNLVFVALFRQGKVVALDGRSLHSVGSVTVGSKPVHPLRVDPPGQRLFVVNSGSSTLSVVATRHLRVIGTIPTGRYPEGLDLNPVTNHAYVANEGDPGTDKNSGRTVSILDLHSARLLATVQTPLGPDGIAFDPNFGLLYVCSESAHLLTVYRLPPRLR